MRELYCNIRKRSKVKPVNDEHSNLIIVCEKVIKCKKLFGKFLSNYWTLISNFINFGLHFPEFVINLTLD